MCHGLLSGLVLLAVLSAQQAGGAVVSTPDPELLLQFPPFEGAWTSDLSSPPHDPIGQFADTFELPDASSITSITFWGFYPASANLPDDRFSLRFFDVSGGVPDTVPREDLSFLSLERTLFTPAGHSVASYQYFATLTPVTLAAGTHGVSIVNDLGGDPRVWSVRLNQDLSGQGFNRNQDGVPWGPVLGELAYELRGFVVPEPGSSLLVAFFLILAGSRRCRK